ncbi:BatD family protein [Fodinibius halophilus]|uniref:Protein BatD n=1 Tax=Fodinibius halophilus TaxID=1736908 RepID=A0A6M1T0D1_9BACT|nr:BatD family protein [Fodinibius halophilus]NGP87437.1 protein BatD [Fodinibius halophilus]
MKKIGKQLSVIVFLLPLLGLLPKQALAQSDVSVDASVSETTIYTGERVGFSIEISGSFNNVSRPKLPEFEGLRLLSNNPSTSRSYSFVNGKSSTTYTYSYYLVAQNKGQQRIPPATVTIDGEEYNTDPINVKIVDRNTSANSSKSEKPDIFLKLEVSDLKPVTGQQIITDVVLFFKDGLEVSSYQQVPGWKAEGFWKEQLQNTRRPKATSTIIDGIRYRKARLLQFSLFPTKAGKLEISPYKIIVSVRSTKSRNDPFSSFFSGFGNNQRQIELTSDPLEVDVKSLPSTENSDYLGAVGSFNISRKISTNTATVGESIELTTNIEGTGNVPLITKPEYELPDGLEVYDPQQGSALNRSNSRISGSKTFTDVFVARSPGDYTIPEKTVSYFNPTQNDFITKTLPALSFNVKENPNKITAASNTQAFPVRPVTGLASWVSPRSSSLISHWWFWMGIILPLAVLGVAYWQKSYIEKMNNDQAFARSQKATDKAMERLDKTITLSEEGNIKQAYNMLQKALTGFISDRLTLPEAGLSNADYIEALKEEDIDENLIKNIRMLLDKCASISYAPDTTHEYLKSHVGLAESTLEKLKKVL